jgi:membrane protein DedA with SNARE-associated domain
MLDIFPYILLFVGTFFEGPLMMVSGGFLYHIGQVLFWPTYIALIAGDFAADLAWYVIGYWGARPFFNRYGRYFDVTPAVIEKIERRFHRRADLVLIVSKLTMGFGLALATLTVAGMLRVSFSRYMLINLVCGFFWTLFLFTIGYFFGNIYELMPKHLGIVFAFLSLAVFFFGLRAAARYLARNDW